MSYAGDLSLDEAWHRISAGAVLVDVRTEAEWRIIGVPDISQLAAEPRFIQWNLPGGLINPGFLEELRDAVPEQAEIVFLCRSGVRSASAAAAATAAGYTGYNILEGFEGVPDHYGERSINGWKNHGLPWAQLGPAPEHSAPDHPGN